MRKILIPGLAMALLAVSFSSQAKKRPTFDHVVILGIDGLSTEGLLDTQTPTLDSLMATGAYNFASRGIIPTVSLPNWSAMFCGMGPESTGVLSNDWTPADGEVFPMVAKEPQGMAPSIFSVLKQQKPSAETVTISCWDALKLVLGTELIDYYDDPGDDAFLVAKSAAKYIEDKKPTVLFAYFMEVDDSLHHGGGHMSEGYKKAIEKVDCSIKTIMAAIHKAGMADNTLVLVVSDHGGRFNYHGGNSFAEFDTPIIYNGKGIRRNYLIGQQIYRYDVAADVIFALGLNIPQVWIGRPVKGAYECYGEPEYVGKDHRMLPPPHFLTKGTAARDGLLAVGETVTLELNKISGMRGDIHYTLDGSVPTKDSPIYSGPVALTQGAKVRARVLSGKDESVVVDGYFRISSPAKGNGLKYSIFQMPTAQALSETFEGLSPAESGTCYEISNKESSWPGIDRLKASLGARLGYSIDGYLQIDEAGTYNIQPWFDGAFRMLLDGETVSCHETPENSHDDLNIPLSEGRHHLHIDYLSTSADGYFDLFYRTPEYGELVLVPAQQFFVEK